MQMDLKVASLETYSKIFTCNSMALFISCLALCVCRKRFNLEFSTKHSSIDEMMNLKCSQTAPTYKQQQTKYDVTATNDSEYEKPILSSVNNSEYHFHRVRVSNGEATCNGMKYVFVSKLPWDRQ